MMWLTDGRTDGQTDGRPDGQTPYHNTSEVTLRAYNNVTKTRTLAATSYNVAQHIFKHTPFPATYASIINVLNY